MLIFHGEIRELIHRHWGLGVTRHFAAERICGLRLEGTRSWPVSIVFDDMKTGRMVSFASGMAGDAALGRVYAAMVRRFARYAEPARMLPLSARMHLKRQPDLLQFHFGWTYRVSLEMTPTTLRHRAVNGQLGVPLPLSLDHQDTETVLRHDVAATQPQPDAQPATNSSGSPVPPF